MSLARANRWLLEHLGAATKVLVVILLDVRVTPTWCHGKDAQGRGVYLVGRHRFRGTGEGDAAITAVLQCLAEGMVPDGVLVIEVAPVSSAVIAAIVDGRFDEHLLDGARGSGKTITVVILLLILMEEHAGRGYALPLRVWWGAWLARRRGQKDRAHA